MERLFEDYTLATDEEMILINEACRWGNYITARYDDDLFIVSLHVEAYEYYVSPDKKTAIMIDDESRGWIVVEEVSI